MVRRWTDTDDEVFTAVTADVAEINIRKNLIYLAEMECFFYCIADPTKYFG